MIPDMKIDNLMCTKDAFVEGRELEDNAFTIMKSEGRFRTCTGGRKGLLLVVSSINCGARHGHVIRVVGSKASIEWDDERPNQMTYEIEGEPVRRLERGAGYLYRGGARRGSHRRRPCRGSVRGMGKPVPPFRCGYRGHDARSEAEYGDFWYPDAEAGLHRASSGLRSA